MRVLGGAGEGSSSPPARMQAPSVSSPPAAGVPPLPARMAAVTSGHDPWPRVVQRQLGRVLQLAVAMVAGIEAIGNASQTLAWGRGLSGGVVPFGWDLCARLGQLDVLVALTAVVIVVPVLAVAVMLAPRWASASSGLDGVEPRGAMDRLATFRLMSGLASAATGFAAVGVALAAVLVAAGLADGTPLQGSCSPGGAAYLAVAIASIGVLLACLVALPVASQLEALDLVRQAEVRRLEQQLGRIEAAAPDGRTAGWWRLLLWVAGFAMVTVVAVFVLAWFVPDVPVLGTAAELAPQGFALAVAYLLTAGLLAVVPACLAWWAVSVDLPGLARGMAALGWLVVLGAAGAMIAGEPPLGATGPLATRPGMAVLVLPIALVLLNSLGIGPGRRNSGGLGMVLVRRTLDLGLADARDGRPELGAPRRSAETPTTAPTRADPDTVVPRRALPRR